MERYISGGEEVRTSWFLVSLGSVCSFFFMDKISSCSISTLASGFYLWILWDFLLCGSVASSIGDLQLALEQFEAECEGIECPFHIRDEQ